MTNKQKKTLTLADGRVVSIALEPDFWDCIKLAASMRGMKWTEWARMVLANIGESGITPVLRLEAMNQVKFAHLFGENRATDLWTADRNKLTKNHGMLNEEQLTDILKSSQIQGESDFGGFTIIFGFDEYGKDFLAVRNNLINHPHFFTTVD